MRFLFIIFLLHFSFQVEAQNSLARLLNKYNAQDIPYISVQELAMPKTKAVILDAREPEEYKVSHLKNAIPVGYNTFDLKQVLLQIKDKQQPIVVYCSIGIRSETIAEKLKKAGFGNVYNLYGGIFEWKNENFKLYNSEEQETDSVHAFSKAWSKWLHKGVKVY